ncbi:uncharacterized protein Bfra_005308 [Botrytis fragariae]|uniref:2EXR domain-containing protein n=1 Tax=Botrytis fragariae TaxID=1964551 RepID=A0A8H6EIV1_9HELO|nr:uncharacterized protein Bfra_005308 [Botrytis fragariae]KAF5873841.1 hypothetical protein Bfra_005308 [Botrytis fragariae]
MAGEILHSLSPKSIKRGILQNLQKLSVRKQTTNPPLPNNNSNFIIAPAIPPLTNDYHDYLNFIMGRESIYASAANIMGNESIYASTVDTIDTPPLTPPISESPISDSPLPKTPVLELQQLSWPLPETLPRMFLRSSTLTTFSLFPFLPKELRVKIWKLAACHPRIVQLTYDHPTESLVSLSPIPALLSTCGEARDELLPLFKQLALPPSTSGARIYVDLDVDTVYVRRAATSIEDASPYTSNFTTTKAIFGANDSAARHPLSDVKHLAIDSSLIDSPIELRLLWGDWNHRSKPSDLKLRELETLKIVYSPICKRHELRKIRGHPQINYDWENNGVKSFIILSREDRWECRHHYPINNGEWVTEPSFSPRVFNYRQGVFVQQDPEFLSRVHVCDNNGEGRREKYFDCPGCHEYMSLGAYRAYMNMMERDVVGWRKPEFEGVVYEREKERDMEYYLWG